MNAPARPDKFRRYRDRQKARGLKEVRRWVYDLDAPGVREKLAAEIARINAAEDAADVERFMDAAWADLDETIRFARLDYNEVIFRPKGRNSASLDSVDRPVE